ncbi:Hypothetical predicted protein [Paramuricea clavata]|uniref:Uncharacterized protein n=1 Tax=Paramuricea clavata TaxID=317549 RepID=A0A6S7HS15_PARCT|nr:Hypothetical predicted protein [Paramuricea clavata]
METKPKQQDNLNYGKLNYECAECPKCTEAKTLFEGENSALAYNDEDDWFDDEDEDFCFTSDNKWFEDAWEAGLREKEEMRHGWKKALEVHLKDVEARYHRAMENLAVTQTEFETLELELCTQEETVETII